MLGENKGKRNKHVYWEMSYPSPEPHLILTWKRQKG